MKMGKKPALALLIAAVVCGLGALAVPAENQPVKGTVYFLVHSGACPCQQEMCLMAKPIAAQIQARLAAGYEYKSLDYGVRPDAVDPLMRRYKIFSFPVILVLDADSQEVFKVQMKIDRNEVLKKLQDLGVITGEG